MLQGGYKGKVLRLDLGRKQAVTEDLSAEMARDFVGGAGFGIKYLYDEVSPQIDALDAANKLIFAVGPFTGTTIPCSSRMSVVAKSPLTGAVGMASTGGYLPAEVKAAGYDVLIIEGRAETPTYIIINEGQVQFRDASGLWGTTTSDCQQMLKDDLRDQEYRIACIGPAGEAMCRIACIINERRAAGRKGLGAVMGSKNLKAIAVRGHQKVDVANPEMFEEARAFMREQMRLSHGLYPMFAKVGSPAAFDVTSGLGILSAKNWQATGQFVPIEQLGVEAGKAQTVGRNPCQGCPVGCSKLKLARSAPYRGVLAEGPEFETLYAMGTQCGVDKLDAVIAADRLCDELGLDTMSAGVTVGFAMELSERGLLAGIETDGLDFSFGNDRTVLAMLTKMAYREGVGDLFADGVRLAAERIGGEAGRYAMHVKGLELPAYDVRGAKAHGLNYATAYTGADHNRGYAFQEIFGIPVPKAVDRFAIEGKGELCKWNQDVRVVTCDCAPLCGFVLDLALAQTAAQNTAAILNALTGFDVTPEEIQTAGERVNNLAKAFNSLAGLSRVDDTLPERLMNEPILAGASEGQHIPREDLDLMLDEYYQARGWDPVTGVPTRAKLEELGMASVANDLGV
jgi:aldehyde:ferredoxin oxidoreductase